MAQFIDDLGEWGEMVAIDHLKEKGYFVCHHDWKWQHKDLDIVAIDNTTKELVFVEVKTRRNNEYGEPEDAVTTEKIRNLKSIAKAYIGFYSISRPCRFDVISVIGTDDTNVQINHFPSAFS